jgi:tRNA-splicing ligase RtcB
MPKFKDIGNATWLMEKEGIMRVPALIIGTKPLVDAMSKDRTIGQLRNMASLPGIVKNAVLMPDGHEGYGFPIGGVAAFDKEEGIVSPGGVGYDINCLVSKTRIISEYGYYRKIEDYEPCFSKKHEKNGVLLFGGNIRINSGKECGKATHFMHKRYSGKIYKIMTMAGEIEVTPDHPIITKNGKKLPKNLKRNDLVLSYPFEGAPYRKYCKNENDLAIYAKLIGYNTGDGSISSNNGKRRVSFYSKYRNDLEDILKDIKKLGYHGTIFERTRKHSIRGKKFVSTASELVVYSKEFAEKMLELGCVEGVKTNKDIKVPQWIMKAPLWIKRLYLAAFFGAEMSSPKTSSKTGFYMPQISQNKIKSREGNLRQFFNSISKMLDEFGIKTKKVSFVEQIRSKIRLRIMLDSSEKNIEKVYSRIGFEYNKERMLKALAAVLYIRMKRLHRQKREEIRKKAQEYKKAGISLKNAQKKLASKWANPRFVERAYYENVSPRAPLNVQSFNEFEKYQKEIYKRYGAFEDIILDIGIKKYSGRVYDFGIERIHRFIGNGILVSNCGVRLLKTEMQKEDIEAKKRDIVESIFREVPSGVGSESRDRMSVNELDSLAELGVDWAIEKGYADKKEKGCIEEYGRMDGADVSKISATAKARGRRQVGTLGAGNHFLEIQYVEKIIYPEIAKSFGLFENQVVMMVHTGSRGYGHQIASDYINAIMKEGLPEGIPDPELAYAKLGTDIADNYISAMKCAVNFAFVNRQMITHNVRAAFSKVFKDAELELLYDVAHNIAKYEEHNVNGKKSNVLVHRKGATRAFPAGREELPAAYRKTGQPVIIPGSMGTASYVLVGEQKGLDVSFGSTCHGAGRALSRHAAIREFNSDNVVKQLAKNDIYFKSDSRTAASEEAPGAYKDIDEIVKSVELAGISRIVAKLRPLGVVKG